MPPKVRAAEWVPANVVMPEECESPGPFRVDRFPHVVGVLEAFDDPMIRQIYLPWASRLGKTITGLSLLAFCAVNSPRPSMVGRESEDKADDLIEAQLLPLLRATPATAARLLPERRQSMRVGVRFDRCRIRKTFSGSPGTMAGFPACYAVGSEVSKWSTRESREADPIYLFTKRGLLYPFDSKYCFDSTPGRKGQCQITELCSRTGVDVRTRHVPCPKCGTFQTLRFGSKDPESAGLKWEHPPGGRSDPDLAEHTAHYRCVNGCRIDNGDRPQMLRAGVWLSEGQTVTPMEVGPDGQFVGGGEIHGSRPEASAVAFGHPDSEDGDELSALHSLMISGWGQIAREWIECAANKKARRDFINSILGRLYDPTPANVSLESLIVRLRGPEPLGLVPEWGVFLTQAIDVGQTMDLMRFYWQVAAWGKGARGHVVDYGIIEGIPALMDHVRNRTWPHADKGPPLRPSLVGIDSGYQADTIYEICRELRDYKAVPTKGRDGFYEYVAVRDLMKSANPQTKARKRRGLIRVGDVVYDVNHERSQQWIQSIIDGELPDREDRFTVAADIADGINVVGRGAFFEHLLAEKPGEEYYRRGVLLHHWPPPEGNNEQRDCCRVNRALADVLVGYGKHWQTLQRVAEHGGKETEAAKPERPAAAMNRPDGREWLDF